jgi:hypothetical protein
VEERGVGEGAEKGKAETCGSCITGTQIYLYSRDHNKTKEGFKTKVVGLCTGKKKKKHTKHPTKAKGAGGKKGRGGRATRMIEYRKK